MPRYGQYTSNLVEQQNWVYLCARELPVFDMLQYICNDMMEKIYKRHTLATATLTPFPPNIVDLFRQEQDAGRTLDVRTASSTAGLVYSRLLGQEQHTATLDPQQLQGECSCGNFESNRRPCAHGHAFLDHIGGAAIAVVDPRYGTASWNRQLEDHLLGPPVRINELELDDSVRPPHHKQGRGRPAKKRMEQGRRIKWRQGRRRAVSESEGEEDFNEDVMDVLVGDPVMDVEDSSEGEAADAFEAEAILQAAEASSECEASSSANVDEAQNPHSM